MAVPQSHTHALENWQMTNTKQIIELPYCPQQVSLPFVFHPVEWGGGHWITPWKELQLSKMKDSELISGTSYRAPLRKTWNYHKRELKLRPKKLTTNAVFTDQLTFVITIGYTCIIILQHSPMMMQLCKPTCELQYQQIQWTQHGHGWNRPYYLYLGCGPLHAWQVRVLFGMWEKHELIGLNTISSLRVWAIACMAGTSPLQDVGKAWVQSHAWVLTHL